MFEDIVDYEISERDLEELDLPDDEEDTDTAKKKKPQVKKSKVLDRIRTIRLVWWSGLCNVFLHSCNPEMQNQARP